METVTETMVLTEPEAQVMHRVPKPPVEPAQDDRLEVKPLMEKFKASYHDPNAQKRVNNMANKGYFYFWFMALTECYVLLRYVVKYHYQSEGEMKVYWVKVWCGWVMIQTIANWLCTRFYDNSYTVTDDKPDLRKTLWDEYNTESEQCREEPIVDEKTGFIWKYCKVCDHRMPPRSHHCVICQKCILKRDHHCYFSGVCIGFRNQRYFVFLNFYIALACLTGMYLIYPYMMETFYPNSDFWDWVPPYTVYRCVWSGTIEWNQMYMVFQLYSFWWIGIMAIGFVLFELLIIASGVTMHEMTTAARVRVSSSVSENFQSVFGSLWLLNLIFPAVLIFKQVGDGIDWEKVKLVRPVVRTRAHTGTQPVNRVLNFNLKKD